MCPARNAGFVGLRSLLVVGLSLSLVSGLSGCQTLRVKLALRDFSRAARRRDRQAVAAHSTKRMRRLVWSRVPAALWKMKWPAGGSKGSHGASRGSGSVKVSVQVHGGRALARVRWKGLSLDFVLAKEKGWKIDDLSVRWGSGKARSRLDLTRDLPALLAVYSFVMAAYQGKRDEMVRWAGPTLLAGGWQKLPAGLFERMSARLRSPSKGPSTGPSDKVASVFFHRDPASKARTMGLVMTSGRRVEVIAARGKQGWVVGDALLTEPRDSGSLRRMRLSHLLAAATALYEFGRKLAGSDLLDIKSIQAHIEPSRAGERRPRLPGRKSGESRTQSRTQSRAQGQAQSRPQSRAQSRPQSRARSRPDRDMLAELLSSLSLDDFDDRAGRLWVAFSWKDAKGRLDFVFQSGHWELSDARLDRNGRSIRLADALGMRDLMVSLIQASLQADVDRIEKLSSPDLDRRVWSRLGPIQRLKERLLGGGLDELLGVAVLPKNVFAKLGFGARIALLARRIASGRLRLVGLWREGNKAFLVIRVGSVPVTVQAVVSGGRWLLDDVTWRVAGKRLSLKTRAGKLLQVWFGPAAGRSS